LAIRMFSAIAALHDSEITLKGEGSLQTRPVSMIEKTLIELGVECKTNNGYIPIHVKGPLRGGSAKVDGSVSSQFLTGLLYALPLLRSNSELFVENLKSKAYIDMTISVLQDFGIQIYHRNYELFKIEGRQIYKSNNYIVEGDWSAVSFFAVAGAIGGHVEIKELNVKSNQADIKIIDAIVKAGAKVSINENSIEIIKDKLIAFEIDISDCPDLFPPLVALAANCRGTTILYGANRLIHKESNRAAVLKNEFAKLKINVSIDGDIMKIIGAEINGAEINPHKDHRIAMAVAIAAINSKDEVIIQDYTCVSKSFPSFFEDFELIGGKLFMSAV